MLKRLFQKKTGNASQTIFEFLELRLDNIVYRLGLSSTRLGARQMVSHGHITVNGKRVNVPSKRLSLGEKIEITERSKSKPLFENLDEKIKNVTVPSWLKFDSIKKMAEVQGMPVMMRGENMFDLNAVIEFYSR